MPSAVASRSISRSASGRSGRIPPTAIEPLGVGPDVLAHEIVRLLGVADDLGSDVVHEHRALDAARVEVVEERGRLLEVSGVRGVGVGQETDRVGTHLPERIDVHVAIRNAHRRPGRPG